MGYVLACLYVSNGKPYSFHSPAAEIIGREVPTGNRIIAEAKGATPAQVALAWLLARKPFIVPIPGTRKLERVEENLGAAQVVLTAADMSEIEKAASGIAVAGERLPPAVLQFSYR